MRTPQDVIIRPYITESSTMAIEQGKYTFIVDKKSNKLEIKNAVEELFNVKVLSVNTMNYEGKLKRMYGHEGRRPSWKKAIVMIDIEPKAETYMEKGGKVVSTNRKYKDSIEEYGATR